ncbi:MAG: protein-glutamate O-methyltransferase CheR [Pseudomonadota bacterium]
MMEQEQQQEQQEDREFMILMQKIKRNRSLDFTLYRRATLRNRIASRLHATGCPTCWDYILLLNRDPAEYDRLIGALTIKKSSFFRDENVFRILEKKIIPGIISRAESTGARRIRAWSCGAAFGQEAYSLAMLFMDALGRRPDAFDIKIFATDIDAEALEKAPWGSYDRRSLGTMRPHLLLKYFTRAGDRYVVSEGARALVTFRRHDIVTDRPLGRMDLVLCRNLLIYFQEELQDKALRCLKSALIPGGFLVLGKAETMARQVRDGFETLDAGERVYRKKVAAEQG